MSAQHTPDRDPEALRRLAPFAGRDSYAGPQALASTGVLHGELVKLLER